MTDQNHSINHPHEEEAKVGIDEETIIEQASFKETQELPHLQFVDHFSLRQPSSSLRFRNANAVGPQSASHLQIYDLPHQQWQLQHTPITLNNENDHDITTTNKSTIQGFTITMQRLHTASIGLVVLRGLYTLVALLCAGFWLVFSCQFVAFQAMEIPRNLSGSADIRGDVLVAYVLSLPIVCYSVASIMTLVCQFVVDVWKGHVLMALLLSMMLPTSNTTSSSRPQQQQTQVMVEWGSVILYICIPALALLIALFTKQDNWDEIAALTIYACFNLSFVIFCALVFGHEMTSALQATQLHYPDLDLTRWQLWKEAIFMTLSHRYAITQEHTYQMHNNNAAQQLDLSLLEPLQTYMPIISRLKWTLLEHCSFLEKFYTRTPQPIRRYSVEELRESVPYITQHNWSLEQLCCQLRLGRQRLLVSGQQALAQQQLQSTRICHVLAIVLTILVVIGLAWHMGQSAIILVVLALIVFLCIGHPLAQSTRQLAQAMPSSTTNNKEGFVSSNNNFAENEDNGNADDDACFYQTWAAFTIAKPQAWYCWTRLAINFILLLAWPTIAMYADGFPKNATLFLGLGIFTFLRLSVDTGAILSEYGTISQIDPSQWHQHDATYHSLSASERRHKDMAARACLSEVLGKITGSPRTWIWLVVFVLIGAYFVWAAVNSQNGEDWQAQSGREPIRLLDDFYYPPQPDILYPTCITSQAFAIPGLETTYALDYNLLAGIAYETTNVTSYILDRWFGGGATTTTSINASSANRWIDETPLVTQWKLDTGHQDSPVSFKLFSQTNQPGVGILSIRGTETPTDRMLNAQLYMGTYLTALVRALMPFSWLWNSIYDDLVATTSWVMSDQLKASSYYRETTQFANDLMQYNYTYQGKTFNKFLRTTGVSLGGGLALITGAQTDAFGYAISGINPVLGRLTFDPPLSMNAINRQVFNTIPDNDMISNIGDKVRNHAGVECRTWPAARQNCHSFWRVFCETLYSCGSPPDRPGALCICVERWGYPEPQRITSSNRSFAQACREEEARFNATVGVGYVETYAG